MFDVHVDVPIALVQIRVLRDALLLERPRGVIDGETTLWWVA